MKRSYVRYIASLLLFGSNGVVASFIALSSWEIVLLRSLLGSALLLAVFLLSGRRFTVREQPRAFVFLAAAGVCMGASWMFLYEAYQRIGVGMATLANYCGPVLVMALSPLLFRERLTWPKLAGFAAVFAGVILVNGKAALSGGMGWGLFCGGMSAVTYAAMIVLNKKASAISGLENALFQLVFAFLTVAVFTGLRQGLHLSLAASDWLPVLTLGLLNTGVGCWLYFSSLGQLPVQTVAICGYLEPLGAVLLSVLLLREPMLPAQAAGAALILGGAVFAECFRPKSKLT